MKHVLIMPRPEDQRIGLVLCGMELCPIWATVETKADADCPKCLAVDPASIRIETRTFETEAEAKAYMHSLKTKTP